MKKLFSLLFLALLVYPSFAGNSAWDSSSALIVDTVFTVMVDYQVSPKDMAKAHNLVLINDSAIVVDYPDTGRRQVKIYLVSIRIPKVKSMEELANFPEAFGYRFANLPEVMAISALYSRKIQLTSGMIMFRPKCWIGLFGMNVLVRQSDDNKCLLLMSMEENPRAGYIYSLVVRK